MITRLRARNFKSFDILDVELGRLNVFVGGNASGKSNLLSLLTFMRDLTSFGLEDAVSLQGGTAFLSNLQHGTDANTELEWFYQAPGEASEEGQVLYYRLAVNLNKNNVAVDEEDLVIGNGTPDSSWTPESLLDTLPVSIHAFRRQGEVHTRAFQHGKARDVENGSSHPSSLSPTETLLSFPREVMAAINGKVGGLLGGLVTPVFNFDLHRLKKESQSLRARNQLEEEGENVALVLRDVLNDEDRRRRFLNLLKTLLPFVNDMSVSRYTEESLVFQLQETFTDTALPSSLLSDGTIQAIALILAMYFDDRPVIAFEEPARSLHPKLTARLVQMMEDAARHKQILLTTHNPEVLRYVDLEDVHFISRDERGFSQVTRPKDSEMVHAFLSDDLGLNDLFVDDLLNV